MVMRKVIRQIACIFSLGALLFATDASCSLKSVLSEIVHLQLFELLSLFFIVCI